MMYNYLEKLLNFNENLAEKLEVEAVEQNKLKQELLELNTNVEVKKEELRSDYNEIKKI